MIIYPIVDSYNSGVCKLSQWFGVKNHKNIKREKRFSYDMVKHYCYYCFSAIPYLLSDYHPISSLMFCIVSLSLHASVCSSALSDLETYENPLDRSNSKGTYFSLGDLLEGPMYKSKSKKINKKCFEMNFE